MNLEFEILEKIELYTSGKLSAADTLAFEKQMASDPSLKRRVEASLVVEEMVIGREALKLKEQMRKDLFPPKFPWRVYVPMALLAISVGGAIYLWPFNNQVATEKKIPQIIIAQKGGNGEVNQPIDSLSKRLTSTIQPKKHDPVVVKDNAVVSVLSPETKATIFLEEKTMPSTVAHAPIFAEEVKSKQTDRVLISCTSLQSGLEFFTVASCAGGETGEIHIKPESVVGGTPPFTFTMGEKSTFTSFYHISPGAYHLQIKDSKGCTVEVKKQVIIASKTCKERKEYTFNPEFDLSWTIPYNSQKEPKIFKVIDKGGKTFLETTVVGLHPTEWKGESNTGLSLGQGLYFFSIEYVDGSLEEGTIVITR